MTIDKGEQLKQYMMEYRQTYKAEIDEWRRRYYPQYYQSHRDEILARSKVYYQEHRLEKSMYRYQNLQKIKAEVLTHYGNGELACVRCGYANIDALSIDHINGDGGKHRCIVGRSTYHWLKRNHYPMGYQTLCMNCQYIKRDENREYKNSSDREGVIVGED